MRSEFLHHALPQLCEHACPLRAQRFDQTRLFVAISVRRQKSSNQRKYAGMTAIIPESVDTIRQIQVLSSALVKNVWLPRACD